MAPVASHEMSTLILLLASPALAAGFAGAHVRASAARVSMSATSSVGLTTASVAETATDAMASLADAFAAGRPLSSAFGANVKVASALWSATGRADLERQVAGFGKFLIEPTLEVLSVQAAGPTRATVEWMVSGTWPLPWRPRALALGTSTLDFGFSSAGALEVVSCEEALVTNPLEVLLRQLMPNWEDVFNQYNTPPAETRPYRVLRRAKGYELRWMPPTLALESEALDGTFPSAQSHILTTPVLPSFAIRGRPLGTKSLFTTIRPLTVECDESGREKNGPCRYRWTVPIPSRLGANADSMPPLEPSARESGAQELRYVKLPGRFVAARTLAGFIASDAVLLAEVDSLAAQLRADGLAPTAGKTSARPCYQLSQYNTKVGFNLDGLVAIAQYQGTVGPMRRNEVLVEVAPPR
ncbi:hypothetical protein T492DRAFT_978985 [Pavlovales sp. CCMP2436]|nr:hypothetical protein T492DRAFT_978985 [Pavlovales sp. CCMP2436]|mmetsp:Transcript_32866/g.81679  ORF Transcript_32866/g.81679 Transcript_32866/m.81679 type:complete len:413 (+) Transcript_32866:3-1241(+)